VHRLSAFASSNVVPAELSLPRFSSFERAEPVSSLRDH
jgi:hypothetical protein